MSRGGASRAWSWRHAVTRSGLPPTTRHVLLTLSIYMDETGRSCFPKVEDLAEATGLSKRSILTHIDAAVAAGWLKRGLHGFRGQRWRQLEYEPMWPERDADLPVDSDGERSDAAGEAAVGDGAEGGAEAGETGSPASPPEVVNVATEAGEPRASKLVNVLHQDRDQSNHQSNTSPEPEREARARSGQEPPGTAFERLARGYPTGFADNLDTARHAFARLSEADRAEALARLPDFLAGLEGRARKHPPALSSYLADRRWTLLPPAAPPPAEALPATATVGAFDRAWWWLYLADVGRHGPGLRDRGSAAAQALANRVALARRRIGWSVPRGEVEAIEAAAMALGKAHVDSPEVRAFRAALWDHAGIDLPLPDASDWVFLPAGDPADWLAAAGEREREGEPA